MTDTDNMLEIVRAWHRDLGNGRRAELRRCREPRKALLTQAGLDLVRRLGAFSWPERAAAIAIVLSHVKQDSNVSLFRACGRAKFSDESALLHNKRFSRLLKTTETDDLMTGLIQIVRLLGGTASIADVVEGLRWHNDRVRQRWAADYFNIRDEQEADDAR